MEWGKRGATLGSFLLFLRVRCVRCAATHEYSLAAERNMRAIFRCIGDVHAELVIDRCFFLPDLIIRESEWTDL